MSLEAGVGGLDASPVFEEIKEEPATESPVSDHLYVAPPEGVTCYRKNNMVYAHLGSGYAREIPVVDDLCVVAPIADCHTAALGITIPLTPVVTVLPHSALGKARDNFAGFSQPGPRQLPPVLVIHDISFQLRRSVLESLESLANLLATFVEVRFLPLGGTSVIELKSPEEICEFVAVAWDEFSKAGMESRAFQDAFEFQLPPEAFTRDLIDLKRCGSLIALISERQAVAAPDRFNIDRVNRCFKHCGLEDMTRLRDMAINGTRFVLPEGFVAQHYPNPMRNIYQRLGNCFDKHAIRLWTEGRVLLLPLSELHLYGPTFNLSSDAWWVGDASKPAGRILIDPSNPKGEGWPLNTPEVKAAAEELYGKLTLPTIMEIVSELLAYVKRRGYAMKDMRWFKYDIKNAFGCLPVDPLLAPYMMIRIGDLLMTHLNNQFGPTVVPCTYVVVVSRCTNLEICHIMDGPCFTYVDDYMGFGHISRVMLEFGEVRAFLLDALGPKALSPKTVLPTLTGEILGWYVNLHCGAQNCATIRPNDKGIRKLALVFLSVDLDDTYWTLHLCQVLASLAKSDQSRDTKRKNLFDGETRS